MAFTEIIETTRYCLDKIKIAYLHYITYFNPETYVGSAPDVGTRTTKTLTKTTKALPTMTAIDNLSYDLEIQLISFRNNLDVLNQQIVQLANNLNQVKTENMILKENISHDIIQQLMFYRQLKYMTDNELLHAFMGEREQMDTFQEEQPMRNHCDVPATQDQAYEIDKSNENATDIEKCTAGCAGDALHDKNICSDLIDEPENFSNFEADLATEISLNCNSSIDTDSLSSL